MKREKTELMDAGRAGALFGGTADDLPRGGAAPAGDGAGAPVIVFANQKGGVAKTTSCLAVAEGMRRAGLSVLTVDMDPQGSLGQLEARHVADGAPGAVAFLKGEPVAPVGGQAAVPGELGLNVVDGELDSAGREIDEGSLGAVIRAAVEAHGFDAVLIDTHPGIGFLEISAVAAADHVIVPTTASRLGAEAVAQMGEFLSMVAESVETRWRDDPAVLITLYRGMTRLESACARQLDEELPKVGFKVFRPRVPLSVAVEVAQMDGEPLYSSRVLRGAAYEYLLVTRTVMDWVGLPPVPDGGAARETGVRL